MVSIKIKSFISQCGRVWRILKRPDGNEYKTTAKVASIGMLIIGLIGFVISFIVNLFPLV